MKLVDVTQWVTPALRGNPTRPKPSQQAGSEVHVQARQREYGAGWNEGAGPVLSPENCIVVVHEDKLPGNWGRKPTALKRVEGSKPESAMVSDQVTTGV